MKSQMAGLPWNGVEKNLLCNFVARSEFCSLFWLIYVCPSLVTGFSQFVNV